MPSVHSTKPSCISQSCLTDGSKPVLRRGDGLSFKNEIFHARSENGRLLLTTRGEESNFAQMNSSRGNQNHPNVSNNGLKERYETGFPLANVGVSAAVRIKIDGTDYLILAARGPKLMLPSGYVDISSVPASAPRDQVYRNTALTEVNEEIITAIHIPKRQGLGFPLNRLAAGTGGFSQLVIHPAGLKEAVMARAYPDQADTTKVGYIRTRSSLITPSSDFSFLPGLNHSPTTYFEDGTTPLGESLKPANGKFYGIRETGSGQIVYSFTIELADLKNTSLLHAETHPETEREPGAIKEVLDPKGLVLAKLDSTTGLLTGETFSLIKGELIPTGITTDKIELSEVFNTETVLANGTKIPVTAKKVVNGKVIRTVTFQDYKASADAARADKTLSFPKNSSIAHHVSEARAIIAKTLLQICPTEPESKPE